MKLILHNQTTLNCAIIMAIINCMISTIPNTKTKNPIKYMKDKLAYNFHYKHASTRPFHSFQSFC